MNSEINEHIEFDEGIPYEEFRQKVELYRDSVLKPRLQKLDEMSKQEKEELIIEASKTQFTCHNPY